MRKTVLAFFIAILVLGLAVPIGCTDKKPQPVDSAVADTMVVDTAVVDSAEQLIEETPMPKAADELFDDFFFNFAANRRLQRRRIDFPLAVNICGKEKKVARKEWKTEHFFMRQDYYTLIFDNYRQLDLVKDTAVGHVVVEKIFLRKNKVQRFFFNRVNGEWRMTSIAVERLGHNKNAGFLKFYDRFSRDSAFQVESMADEVVFTAPDPNDDFASINGIMMPQQWPDFKPGLIPKGIIYNIIYGQKYTSSKRRILIIRGIANGLEIELEFRRIGGHWKLVKFNS